MSEIAPQQQLTVNANKWLGEGRVNAFQIQMLVACALLAITEGYDLYVYGAALPTLSKALHLSEWEAGALGSAAAFGTLIGALIFGPLADRVGRKRIILSCTIISYGSMALAAISSGSVSFASARLLFGIVNGGILINVLALISEYIPHRRRLTLIGTTVATGVSLGTASGALVGILVMPHVGWRAIFGGAACLVVLYPLYHRFLPEATGYLIRSGQKERLRHFMRRAQPDARLSDDAVLTADVPAAKVPLIEVFRDNRAVPTLLFLLCYMCSTYVNNGFSFWLPKLMVNQGHTDTASIALLLPAALTAVPVSIIGGRLADRFDARPVLAVLFLLAGASIALLGFTHNYVFLLVFAGLAGGAFNSVQNLLNSYSPSYYRPSTRSTATAYNFALGRVGGIVGPIVLGGLSGGGAPFKLTIVVLAVPALVGAIAINLISRRHNYSHQLLVEKSTAD
ncbi:MFS transporter [Amycolatopsis acidicola]|uniref:MFS transporter n=1 Tax=Amycolatopsis acidicola TaxID=2596893 RepID=A0A5N0VD54_9PSEU|nr:MFS transporter [Amycolatopsis acidicola]KAA9163995.1 MFS transporter [Amycolatopsis acidicola]